MKSVSCELKQRPVHDIRLDRLPGCRETSRSSERGVASEEKHSCDFARRVCPLLANDGKGAIDVDQTVVYRPLIDKRRELIRASIIPKFRQLIGAPARRGIIGWHAALPELKR
jgi:hypothetical protein